MSTQMRAPCKKCGHEFGTVSNRNGQDVMFCGECGTYAYCVPKTESGKKQRSVRTTHESITPKMRMRIFERAGGKCDICGAVGRVIHVGHFVSVIDGHRLGMTDAEITSAENLFCCCEECNLGGGRETVSLRLAVNIIRARLLVGDRV